MYIEREIKKQFEHLSGVYNIVAVIGPRQAGKTTFLKEKIKRMGAAYITMDDPDVRLLFDEDVKKFENQYIAGKEVAVIDEVQYGKDAGRKLKYLADKGHRIWITSSSQVLLGKEVLSWLVGRVTLIKLYPFSFDEFLSAKGQKETTQEITKRSVWEHAVYGGYPKVVLTEDREIKVTLLRDLYSTMVLKDIANTFSIANSRALEEFARYLSYSIGNILVYEKVASEMQISFQTIKKYVDAMEKSYLIHIVQPFFTNKLKEVTKQPKVYFVDTGIRNAIANKFPPSLENEGKLFENYVLTEIIKHGFKPKYWLTKTELEVDFIIESNNAVIPIEVKLSAIPNKVEKGLRSFIGRYKPKTAIVVSYDGMHGETMVDECRVIFTDVYGLSKLLKKTTP